MTTSNDFPIDTLLIELSQSNGITDNSKDKIMKLKKHLHYVAPELLGEVLFTGYKSTEGLVTILTNNGHDDQCEENIREHYDNIVTKFKQWANKYEDNIAK